ncbi:hypothetical protein F383_08571 [Gossypium arboreum]|uniref:Uncharacterized protein n=1 Tax=Gossypium arboreum TaxID=29729 RepID=A0A0B0P1R8_GOSAR|nr:hypothetical protein F383_08571 [Gossypium arboreum]
MLLQYHSIQSNAKILLQFYSIPALFNYSHIPLQSTKHTLRVIIV